jgi:hypothetical protein
LTEDDLQSLVNYVAGKNRLHASYLFGPGVVCGLKVKHEPCKCGRVIVEPGYALDCCGNDVVVSCPQPLDINTMINALMLKLRGGYDCGDPCAPQEKKDASSSAGSTSQGGASSPGTPSQSSGSKSRPKRYDLYVKYCEQDTDPVTPYATSTPCGQSVCQPTRVQEGFQFELRCPTNNCDCKPAICESLSDCQGDRKAADAAATDASALELVAHPIAVAAQRIRDGMIPDFQSDALGRANLELERFEESESFDLARLRELILITRRAATDLARFLQPERWQRAAVSATADHLAKAAEILECHKHLLPTPLEKSYVDALQEVIEELTGFPVAKISEEEARDLSLQIRFLQWDAVMTYPLLREAVNVMRHVREWLLDRMELGGLPADPWLEREAEYALPVAEWPLHTIERLALYTADVATKCLKFRRDCQCNALLPPCSTCTDTGVLLACVTVQECCVTEICNLDRKFVLTGPNLRYWFPEIQQLGCEIEKCCCSSCACERSSLATYADEARDSGGNLCDVIFGLLQLPCDDRPYKRAEVIRTWFTAQTGKIGAERGLPVPTDRPWSDEIDKIREEIRGLKSETAKWRDRALRAEKKSKLET